MKTNKPVFSRRVSMGTRVYYIDVHKDSKGQHFIAISEIPTDLMPGNKKRQRVFIHADGLAEFFAAFSETVEYLRKESSK